MGVQGLWTLLEPVGRRINIEAIQNKRLAVGERGMGAAGTARTRWAVAHVAAAVSRWGLSEDHRHEH